MEEYDDEECMTGLSLGIGMGEGHVATKDKVMKLSPKPKDEELTINVNAAEMRISLDAIIKNTTTTITTDSEDNNNINKNGCRKKLRLTKEQSSMLENTFKLHTTLNHAQKQALADQLNLKTRQIEVWFQNRRARTKLKQTEVDRELLKKECQNLSDENRRLKKELHALKGTLCIQLSNKPTNLTMICSSCHKLLKLDNQANNTNLIIN